MAGSIRTIAYIDGFNLYHAVHDLNAPYLKWIDLAALCRRLLGDEHTLVKIRYCSAYATHRPASYRRHQRFVGAQGVLVEPLMGRFKPKDKSCRNCGSRWVENEEKETDVNLAVQLVNDAHKAEHDCSLLISADSDLVPAVRVLRDEFRDLMVRIVFPTGRTSDGLLKAAGLKWPKKMQRADLVHSLLPRSVTTKSGAVITRPIEYDPPPAAPPPSTT